MKNILSLDEFISRKSEFFERYYMQNEDVEAINEGLLQNLFGAIFKKDMWSTIQGEDSIKREFREIDNKLNGFYLTKIKNPNASQDVRQTLVDWAGEIYKAKVKLKEELDKDENIKLKDSEKMLVITSLCPSEDEDSEKKSKEVKDSVSDETSKKIDKVKKAKKENDELAEKTKKLEDEVKKINGKYGKELDQVAGSSPDLKRWANILKSRMEDILDKIIAGKYDEENILAKDLEELQKKKDERLKKKNDEEAKAENEKLKKLEEERNSVLKNCGAEVTSEKTGTGFLKKVEEALKTDALFEGKSVFDDKKKANIEVFNKAGLEKLLGINVKVVGKNTTSKQLFNTLLTMNTVVLSNIEKDFKKTIGDVSGVSMQGFLVSYCNLILSCLAKKKQLQDDMKLCMARCAVYNNTLVGFGLPCPDSLESAKDEDKKSMFAYYINKTLAEWKKDPKKAEQAKQLEALCKEIVDRAKKLVEENNKEEEQELKKEEQEQKKEEGK